MVLFGTVNVAAFDWPWSAVHFLSGALVGATLVASVPRIKIRRFWWVGVGILVLWELFEGMLRYLDANAHAFIAPVKSVLHDFAFAIESPANIVGDIAIGSLGLTLGRKLRLRR